MTNTLTGHQTMSNKQVSATASTPTSIIEVSLQISLPGKSEIQLGHCSWAQEPAMVPIVYKIRTMYPGRVQILNGHPLHQEEIGSLA